MVNINIQLPDDLHKQLKIKALTNEISLKNYVIDKLDSYKNKKSKLKKKEIKEKRN